MKAKKLGVTIMSLMMFVTWKLSIFEDVVYAVAIRNSQSKIRIVRIFT